ncbi:MAG: hypothetical protein CVT92_12230 [Bacteroidetes bacterium HGW-Bacteroidetes-1]|jgi:hypothetical protein|nr:MAG: hypothetical protein CVT92_12230 [Bacteroidetes bacterium HGW-Bacteroidetes-1]
MSFYRIIVRLLIFTFLSTAVFPLCAQTRSVGSFVVDETEFYAMTKQMSQFFSRFNNEEDQFGKKYHPSSADYRNNEKRKQILPLMFDLENLRTTSALKDFFIEDLTTTKDSNYMEFLGGRWFAEVSSTFEFQGKTVTLVMILKIEKEGLGSKWVLSNIYLPAFNKFFPTGELVEREKHFLHPMSHELDFMNIYKAFKQPEVIEYYASKSFDPDYLTLFFYEVKLGHLKFVKIDNLKFHIFQIKDWYYEVSYFNRAGKNTGWLISNLMYVTENEKESLIKFYEP